MAPSSGLSSTSPTRLSAARGWGFGFLCLIPPCVLSTQQLLKKYGLNEKTNGHSDGSELESTLTVCSAQSEG